MTHLNQTRLTSGPDAGRLRIMLDIRLSEADEMALAALLGPEAREEARANLALPVRGRGLGPVADLALDSAWDGLADAVEKGLGKLKKRKKARHA